MRIVLWLSIAMVTLTYFISMVQNFPSYLSSGPNTKKQGVLGNTRNTLFRRACVCIYIKLKKLILIGAF